MKKYKWKTAFVYTKRTWFKESTQYTNNWYITKNGIGEFVLYGNILDDVRPPFKFLRTAKLVADLLDNG